VLFKGNKSQRDKDIWKFSANGQAKQHEKHSASKLGSCLNYSFDPSPRGQNKHFDADDDDDDDDDDVDLGFAGALPKTGHLFCSSCVCCACALGWPTALNNGVNHSHEICAKRGDDEETTTPGWLVIIMKIQNSPKLLWAERGIFIAG